MNKLVLTSADGEAEFWPDYGGNCVRFDCGRARLLRTPASEREMAETPLLYGMPLLVPPNRIRGGSPLCGAVYPPLIVRIREGAAAPSAALSG